MPKNLSNRALANRVRRGVGVPSKNEGNDGDLVVRRTSSGDILYLKSGGRWSVIGKLEQIMSRGDSLDKQLKLIGRSSKALTMTASRLTVNQDYIISTSGYQLLLDVNNKDTLTTTNRGLYIDYDHIGICASGQTIINRGLQVGVTSSSPTMVGTVVNYGIYANTVGGTSGTQTGYGIYNTISGHDNNYGIYQTVTDGHPDIRMVSSANNADYCEISVTAEGATTIATVDADTAVAHLTLDVDGDIYLNADGGEVYFKDATNLLARISSAQLILNEASQSALSDTFSITVSDANGATDIACTDAVGNEADMTITADGWMKLVSYAAHDITLDSGGDIELNSDGGQVTIKDGAASHFKFNCDNTAFTIYDDADEADMFSILVGASGATNILTVDDGAAIGHLSLIPDGDLILDPASQKIIINATDKLYLDGGTHTYIAETSDDVLDVYVGADNLIKISESAVSLSQKVEILGSHLEIDATKRFFFDGGDDTYIYEHAADYVRFYVGGDVLMTWDENGDDGNQVLFNDASVGFTRAQATFSATGAFSFGDLGGTDDTDIDFRFTNKYRLEMIGDITNMNLIFPATSGNFLLVCDIAAGGGGDHDVTNWKVYAANESAATTTDVMWAGGSVPTFTSGASVDIVSFYWDASEQQAYGTASLAFATP